MSIAHRHAGVPGAGRDPHIPLALPMAAHLQQHIWVQDTSGEPQPGHPLPPPAPTTGFGILWDPAAPLAQSPVWGGAAGSPPPSRQRGRQCRRGGSADVPGSPGPANPQSSFAHRPSQEVPAWCHEVGDSDSEQAWRVVPVGIAPAPSLQHTAEPLPRDTLGCSGDRHGQRWSGTMAALCGCWGQRDKLQGQSCAGPLTLSGSNTQYTVPPARGGQRVPELAQGATAPAWEEGCHNEEE